MEQRELVVIVPGLGFSGLEMLPLVGRLRRNGHAVMLFRNTPGVRGLERSVNLLRKRLESVPEPVVHFVGHSLGGLVVLRMLATGSWARPGRIVNIGTPHTGLAAARMLRLIPAGHRLFLGVHEAATRNPAELRCDRELGTIGGTRRFPFGGLLVPGVPSDGVVAIAEARHPQSRAHMTLPESHVTLLLARTVVKSVDLFLREGRFP